MLLKYSKLRLLRANKVQNTILITPEERAEWLLIIAHRKL